MENVTKMWEKWLPKSAQATMKKGGYYTALIKTGWRIISLNTQYCDPMNFWLWLNPTDPAGQLAWLEGVMAEAAANKELVYIIGHIPPGDQGCRSDYAEKYYSLINNYSSIVIGQFFGHSHQDYYEVFRSEKNDLEPVNVVYVAPSITPYIGVNPSFRVYEYDSSSLYLTNYYQYIADLAAANKGNVMNFTLEYDVRSAYGLPDMTPASFQNLTIRFSDNITMLETFYKRRYTQGPGGAGNCTGSCVKSQICNLESGFGDLYQACMNS